MNAKPTNETTAWTASVNSLWRGLWKENPVFFQLLGMCPVLAVSNTLQNSIAMGLATTGVLICSNFFVSLFRNWIPEQIRIAIYIMIIATFVTVADYVLQAVDLEIHKALGPFISLIVVNCIILSRAESFAARNSVFPALIDAVGTGAGFTTAIVMMGGLRELTGMGSLGGVDVFGPRFAGWQVMILPAGGFFSLGLLLTGLAAWQKYRAPGEKKPGSGQSGGEHHAN